jgi:hypothetical protein
MEVVVLSEMKCWTLPKSWCFAVALAALIGLGAASSALAQGESKGENFSAKPAAQLFASDCTGAGCHKSPQGLAKGQGTGSLASFLREHYTNSRESAAALAAYLTKQPSGAEPKEARAPRGGKPAPAPVASGPAGWFQSTPNEGKRHPTSRTSTAARHEEPAATQRHDLEGNEPQPAKPTPRERAQRNRHPAAPATAAVPPTTAAPAEPAAPATPAAPAPEPAPTVAAAPAVAPSPAPASAPTSAAPAKKQYDIFD